MLIVASGFIYSHFSYQEKRKPRLFFLGTTWIFYVIAPYLGNTNNNFYRRIEVYSEEELGKIESVIATYDIELLMLKDDFEKEMKLLKEKYKQKKKEILGKKAVLVKKIRWQEFSNSHYNRKDHTETIAYQMFGKMRKDLTEDELREYNKLMTRKSREKNKK